MSVAKKFNKAHAALKGFFIHDGFLSDETLIRFVQDRTFEKRRKEICNDRFRAFRDSFLEFERDSEKYLFKRKNLEKVRNLYTEWLKEVISYLGYSDFVESKVQHPEKEGDVPYLESKDNSHSLAIFLCNSPEAPMSAFEGGASITTLSGDILFKSSKKESLSEQVERTLKETGHSEALLLMPFNLYYYRSESQMTGQCLAANLSEIMTSGSDESLILLSHLFNESFFALKEESEEESESAASTLLFKEDLEQSRRITEELYKQVILATELLCNERLSVDRAFLKESLRKSYNLKNSQELFKNGLFVLYRILFMFFAESKKHEKGRAFFL